jgi:hypothetical protein
MKDIKEILLIEKMKLWGKVYFNLFKQKELTEKNIIALANSAVEDFENRFTEEVEDCLKTIHFQNTQK